MKINFQGTELDFTPPWPRISMVNAISEYAGIDWLSITTDEDAVALGKRLNLDLKGKKTKGMVLDELISVYVEPRLIQPTFLQDYPVEISPLTGGNVALIHPDVVLKQSHRIAQSMALRKKPIQLCRLLGFGFLFKWLMRSLTVAEIEERVQTILKFKGRGIISPYAEIGVDVDKPSDLDLAREVLAR